MLKEKSFVNQSEDRMFPNAAGMYENERIWYNSDQIAKRQLISADGGTGKQNWNNITRSIS